MAFPPPEYCRLFAQKKAYQGGVRGTPGPPLATPLILLRFRIFCLCLSFVVCQQGNDRNFFVFLGESTMIWHLLMTTLACIMHQAEILTNYFFFQVVDSLILVVQGATMLCDLVVSVNFWSSLMTGHPLISNPAQFLFGCFLQM